MCEFILLAPPVLAIMGLNTQELFIIAIIVLVLFGSRLPSVMRSLGSSVVSFKKGMKDADEEDQRLEGQDKA